jgi:hypothetical protein
MKNEQVSEPTPEALNEYWDRQEVASFLGVAPMSVRRLEKDGKLTGHVKPGTRGGKVVYDPEQVTALKGSPTVDVQQDEEVKGNDLVRAAVDLSRQNAEHAAFLLQLVQEPAGELLKMFMEENQQLRARIRELEVDRTEQFKLMEQMRSQQHERELEQMQWYANNERKDAMFKLVVDQAPRLTQQIVASGQAPQLLDSLSGLAKSLSAEQVSNLMGILNESQSMQLAKVLDAVKDEKQTADEPHALLKG